jgi:hypothetical protein
MRRPVIERSREKSDRPTRQRRRHRTSLGGTACGERTLERAFEHRPQPSHHRLNLFTVKRPGAPRRLAVDARRSVLARGQLLIQGRRFETCPAHVGSACKKERVGPILPSSDGYENGGGSTRESTRRCRALRGATQAGSPLGRMPALHCERVVMAALVAASLQGPAESPSSRKSKPRAEDPGDR